MHADVRIQTPNWRKLAQTNATVRRPAEGGERAYDELDEAAAGISLEAGRGRLPSGRLVVWERMPKKASMSTRDCRSSL